MPSRALLTEVQTISNAEIVQALANVKIVATSGIISTFPATASTLAGLSVAQTFTANQTFSGTIVIAATSSTAGQITQAGARFLHTFTPPAQNQNVFIGFEAGRTSTMTGGGNVGIGRAVLQGLTSGSNNLCFGDGVAYAVSSGSSNVMIGQGSANNLTTGSNNVGCGVGSLGLLVSGVSNSALGYQALKSMTASQSVGVGFNSGEFATGNNGVFVGQSAGAATATVGGLAGVAITSGTNNTMLGQASSSTSATGTYRTAIGSDSRCNADNAIKLGRDTLDRVIFPSWTADPTTDLVVGMVIYRSDTPALKIYTSAGWKTITVT